MSYILYNMLSTHTNHLFSTVSVRSKVLSSCSLNLKSLKFPSNITSGLIACLIKYFISLSELVSSINITPQFKIFTIFHFLCDFLKRPLRCSNCIHIIFSFSINVFLYFCNRLYSIFYYLSSIITVNILFFVLISFCSLNLTSSSRTTERNLLNHFVVVVE